MKKIYAPWRGNYVSNIVHSKKRVGNEHSCVFCEAFSSDNDDDFFIVKRGKNAGVILNLYPYSTGHVMVIPYDHKPRLSDLASETRQEIIELVTISMEALDKTIKPQGFNSGINTGKASGAGIPDHLHMHVVPRWYGDTNFMLTVSDTKVVSIDLKKTHKQLKEAFASF